MGLVGLWGFFFSSVAVQQSKAVPTLTIGPCVPIILALLYLYAFSSGVKELCAASGRGEKRDKVETVIVSSNDTRDIVIFR